MGGPKPTLDQVTALYRAGRFAEAAILCEQLVEQAPGDSAPIELLGILALRQGQAARASELLGRAIAIDPDQAAFYYNLALAETALRRPERAIEAYRKALALHPKSAQAHNNLGNLLESLGRFAEAAESYHRSLAVDDTRSGVHRNLGNVLMKQGRAAKAAEADRRGLAIEPQDGGSLNALGRAERELGHYDAARGLHRQVLAADPDNAEALNALGLIHRREGNLEQAVSAFVQALVKRPGHPEALSNLCAAYLDRGEALKALETCDAALQFDPGRGGILTLKAAALLELGRESDARFLMDFDRLIASRRLEPPAAFRSLAAFNEALIGALRSHPTLRRDPANKTTREGRQTEELLDGSALFRSFEIQVRRAIDAYVRELPEDSRHPFLAHRLRDYRLTAWGVVLQEGGYQEPHTHPSGWVSGVYYLQIPEAAAADRDERAGWIEFGLRGPGIRTASDPETRSYRPQPGTLLLFPSFFWHRTVPFEASGERISIAFDAFGQS